ncbi:UNVERIFIED_CONTAM: hypothetical protein RMT77_015489 [Armadillidium vulgare]
MTENTSEFELSSNYTDSSITSSLFRTLVLIFEEIFWYIEEIILGNEAGVHAFISITPVQVVLLQIFLTTLLITLISIAVAWQIYSQRISQTLASNQNRVIEELFRKSNSPLRLPREHSPRY